MVLSIVLQILLGLGFIMFGYQKFVSEDMKQGFIHFGYGDGIRIFTGLFEVIAGIVIIVGIWIKPLAAVGGLMIVATMLGAILTHVKIKDEIKNMSMPFILLILGITVSVLNWFHLF